MDNSLAQEDIQTIIKIILFGMFATVHVSTEVLSKTFSIWIN